MVALHSWNSNGGTYRLLSAVLLLLSFTAKIAQAQIPLDLGDPESIKNAASIAAKGMMREYVGDKPGQIPGLFPPPYYWWEAGAAWGALVDYWFFTKSEEYVNTTTQALLFQTGPQNNYMPPNQSKSLGNDDQCFWALTVMSAAEKKFPDPPPEQPQWLALAQAVFNSQTRRWDETTCGGGLRWQIFTFNNGYDYKNSISNGCFFQLGARLARYTRNETYAQWAEKAYDWVVRKNLLDETYRVFDGIQVEPSGTENCSDKDVLQWSYNAGTFIAGAAYMYDFTKDPKWKERLDGLIDAASVFFASGKQGKEGVMYEVACELPRTCNVDQRSFKAYLSRFMTLAVKIAPHTYDKIMPRIRISAQAAAAACKAQPLGTTCTLRWAAESLSTSEMQTYVGLGEQMSALEVIQSNLIDTVATPFTVDTGGTSKGDPTAGMDDDKIPQSLDLEPVRTSDRVGAGFLTAIVLTGVLSGAWWMVV